MMAEEIYAAESKKRVEAAKAAAGGYLVDVVTMDGRVTRGMVTDFGRMGVEVKPKGGFEFGWGYGILVSWEDLVTIERYEPGVEEAVEIAKRRAAEAEARAETREPAERLMDAADVLAELG